MNEEPTYIYRVVDEDGNPVRKYPWTNRQHFYPKESTARSVATQQSNYWDDSKTFRVQRGKVEWE